MSHRSRLFQERNKLSSSVPTFANKQPKPQQAPQQQVTIDQLAAFLMSQGAPAGYKLMTAEDPATVRLIAYVGPLQIPLDFTPEKSRDLALSLTQAADQVDPPIVIHDPDGPIAYGQVDCMLPAGSGDEFTMSMADALAEAEKTMDEMERGYVPAAEAATDSPE